MFTIVPETNINFIGARKIAFAISIVLVIGGLFATVLVWTGKADLGIDFAGGTMIYAAFEKPVAIEDLRMAVSSAAPDAQITQLQNFEKPNAFILKTKRPTVEGEGQQRLTAIEGAIRQRFTDNSFEKVSEHIIGPAVGESLRSDTQKAVLLSLLGILVYIWIRFDFRFGVAAAVATFHDVLAVLGIMLLLGFEFDLLLVTALLTLAGYSLTDTVVVFDRIRENLKKWRTKGEFAGAVNRSINEIISRTINTGGTTLVSILALTIFGGEVLRTFSVAMVLGIIVGTYSSWFVASPIVVEWEARRPKRFK
ncbi:MAG TPA: protein translocase subunit SecF [candidate division Zixibacteria bacterium]|nr:protein translocase subunit SecF [candidate division Zixibacteria bacterium]MDD4916575.1 protein translocase subunit SecF [candidate division Zixibacteria bacterium]MDM7973741.1 protein translocase subunit SecF [candidate division Zixibacteria bacterium]HOD65762.1 protein translocase subunit SecF [candidate division Zixibacteria bacterium]HOZ06930.1 protein translocase subunit SecF [candidate division Zixibacteria bacterium]